MLAVCVWMEQGVPAPQWAVTIDLFDASATECLSVADHGSVHPTREYALAAGRKLAVERGLPLYLNDHGTSYTMIPVAG